MTERSPGNDQPSKAIDRLEPCNDAQMRASLKNGLTAPPTGTGAVHHASSSRMTDRLSRSLSRKWGTGVVPFNPLGTIAFAAEASETEQLDAASVDLNIRGSKAFSVFGALRQREFLRNRGRLCRLHDTTGVGRSSEATKNTVWRISLRAE